MGDRDGNGVKTLKVWSARRLIRKAVIASTFDEFVQKSKTKFGVQGNVTFVLNEDGTEVDAEYFTVLDNNVVVLILNPGDRWTDASSIQHPEETVGAQSGSERVGSVQYPIEEAIACKPDTTPSPPQPEEKRVLFSASFSTHVDISPDQVLVFDQVPMNVGGLYYKDVGIFISDRDGDFLFSWSIYKMAGEFFSVHLMLDGTVMASSFSGLTGPESLSGSLALPLKKGNKVWLKSAHKKAGVHAGSYAYFSAVSL